MAGIEMITEESHCRAMNLRHCARAAVLALFLTNVSELYVMAATFPDSCKIPAALRKKFAEHPAASEYKTLGLHFNNEHEFACAITAFQQAVKLKPGAIELRLNLANLLAGQGRFEEAAQQADKAVQFAPTNTKALTLLAKIRTRLGQTRKAIAAFRKLIAAHPNSAKAHVNLGIALADASDFAGALNEFTKAVRLAPNAAMPHFNRGRVLYDLRRYPEAEEELEMANRIAPDSARILYHLATAERALNHFNRSAKLLRKLVKIDPGNADAYRLLGQDLARLGESSDAVSQWKKVLSLDPDNTEALYGLVRAFHSSDPKQAKVYEHRLEVIQAKNQALERAKALSDFGIAFSNSRDFTKAIQQLTEAVKVCGHCGILPLLHKNLGLIYLRAGKLAAGKRELRISLALNSNDPEVKSVLDRLKRMRSRSR